MAFPCLRRHQFNNTDQFSLENLETYCEGSIPRLQEQLHPSSHGNSQDSAPPHLPPHPLEVPMGVEEQRGSQHLDIPSRGIEKAVIYV